MLNSFLWLKYNVIIQNLDLGYVKKNCLFDI